MYAKVWRAYGGSLRNSVLVGFSTAALCTLFSTAALELSTSRGWVTYRLMGLGWNPYNALGVISMQSVSFVFLNALMLMGLISRVDCSAIDSAL